MITCTPSTRLPRRVRSALVVATTLMGGLGSALPAAASNVCISMSGSGGVVAGVQLALKWDSACMSADAGSGVAARCTADPATGKDIHTSLKAGPGNLTALFFSMSDTNPIPDGDLFCCSFTRSSGSGNACCGLSMGRIIGSDGTGRALSTSDFSLMATVDGQICGSEGGGGGQQQPARGGLQGGGGVIAPPVVSAPGGNPPTGGGAQQAPAAGGQAAPGGGSGQPASGNQPAMGGQPAGSGPPAAVPGKPETQEAPSGMDQVQRALEQLRGAPTAAVEVGTSPAVGTPKPAAAAGTPTAPIHGTPTAAAKKTAETRATPGAQQTPATPKATPGSTKD